MKARIYLVLFCLFALLPVSASVAQDLLPDDNGIFQYHKPPRYRDSESHPLRIVGYVVHPVGWVLREAVFRPFSALMGSTRFTRSFFGFREPYDYREPMCFHGSDIVPDCHNVGPYNAIGGPQNSQTNESGEGKVVSMERQVYFPDVAFEFDRSTLNALGKGRVRQVAQLLASVPSLKVVVEGHTDSVGSDTYNQKLGEKRAAVVAKELGELGVDPARMSPVTMGESHPIFTENEDWARAVNRRVQFSVQGEGSTASAG